MKQGECMSKSSKSSTSTIKMKFSSTHVKKAESISEMSISIILFRITEICKLLYLVTVH